MAEFVSLAAFVRGPVPALATAVAPPETAEGSCGSGDASDAPGLAVDLARELALLRLAALEAFERSTAAALAAFASDVLGRELALAPVDIEALARRALARFAELEPLALAFSPADAERLSGPLPLPMRVDPALGPGDLVVDVRDGTLESSFVLRLASALASKDGPG